MQPATDYPCLIPRSSPPILLAEEYDSQWKCVEAVRVSLAALLLSLRLLVAPHNRPTLLMRESVDKKLLSCFPPCRIRKCKIEPSGVNAPDSRARFQFKT